MVPKKNFSNTVKQKALFLGKLKGNLKGKNHILVRTSYNSTPALVPIETSSAGNRPDLVSQDDDGLNQEGQDLTELRDFLEKEEKDKGRNKNLVVARSTAMTPSLNVVSGPKKGGSSSTNRKNALDQFSDQSSDIL